jgi:alpha-2-macroglobulin
MRNQKRWIGVVAVLAVFLGACTSSSKPSASSSTAGPVDTTESSKPTSPKNTSPKATVDDGPGKIIKAIASAALPPGAAAPRLFGVNLTKAVLTQETPKPADIVAGEPIDDAKLKELIGTLPKWDDVAELAASFKWPIQSSPPPRTGKTITETFPPASSLNPPPTNVDNGPLKVLRAQPEGEVPIAPYFSITFNQPMVGVGTVSQVNASEVPVTLDPAIAGRWQWIGTRTLRFDADLKDVDRLPMATTFKATVPAGTKSATGSVLAAAATFAFATPAPKVESFTPDYTDIPDAPGLPLEPVFVAVFDQRIDPTGTLNAIKLRANGVSVPLRVATAAEIKADERAKTLTDSAQPGRWIAIRPVSALSTDAQLEITVGPNVPSSEGTRTSDQTWNYSARTYAPLKVKRVSCSFGDECPPGTELTVEFNNPLDPSAAATRDAVVKVEPALVSQGVSITSTIGIQGATKAQTKYSITVPSTLTDIFGQKLGRDETVTITIGSSRPSINQFGVITTLDPFADSQKLSVLTTNRPELRVRVFAADPSQFPQYLEYTQNRYDPKAKLPNWRVLSDAKVNPSGDKEATIETLVDLGPQLGGKPGQVIVYVEPVPGFSPGDDRFYENQPAISWVQSSQLAVDAFSDGENTRAWVTDLKTGAPLTGVTIKPNVGVSATTSDGGIATIAIAPGETIEFVQATKGADNFVLPVQATSNLPFDQVSWFVFDDRQIYRPGETINVKGWVRSINGKTSALSLATGKAASYTVVDGFGVELAKGSAPIGPLGGFDFKVAIPATANVGGANIQFGLDDDPGNGTHSFQIAEFRRPEFEVNVSPVTPQPFVSTQKVTMAAEASYLAGGPLANAPVTWTVSTAETTFSPVGWDEFTFGIFRGWWFFEDFGIRGQTFSRIDERSFPGGPNGGTDVKQYPGVTDANGRNGLDLNFVGKDGVLPDLPVSVAASASVTDVNRQAWADQQSLLVHSANRYVGLRSERTFVRQGDPMNISAVVTDVDGNAQAGSKITVTAGLLRSSFKNGKYVSEVVDPQSCAITSEAKPSTCEFTTPIGGEYRVSSTVVDANGGRNRTELTVWVSGAATQPARTVEKETLTVIPDKKEYRAGDTAKLLVQAPFAKGEGLVLVTHGNGVRDTQPFRTTTGSAEVSIAITEADVPNLAVTIEVVGATDRVGIDGKKVAGAAQRPAYAVGALMLSVPPLSRTLKVTATPAAKELEPGGKTTVAVTVNDAGGAPVKDAEFAVVVVDEAVLGLTDYKLPNPIEFFYPSGYNPLNAQYGRDQVRLVDPQSLVPGETTATTTAPGAAANGALAYATEAAAAAPAEAKADLKKARPVLRDKQRADSSGRTPSAPTVRSNFDALALFAPNVKTDAEGKATVEVTLPDNLTRYRIMVVAASGKEKFGTVESNITARLPLAIRPSAPRFLNTGDQFELPVVVQNTSAKAMTVDVVVQIANLDLATTAANRDVALNGVVGRRVEVAANDRREIRFPMKVRSAGTAKFRATVFGPSSSDSAEQSLPVYVPATAEAFATYGTLDGASGVEAVKQPLIAPKDVIDSFGGLEVSTSSTSLQALTDALLYVDKYDYESSDAYASRIMSISALRKVLKDFGSADLPSEAELNAAVERDIAGLVALQNGDGGWPFWRLNERSEPYNSLQATHALLLAKAAGYAVWPSALEQALSYTNTIEQYVQTEWYSEIERQAMRAYGIWILDLAGQRDSGKAAALFAEKGEKLPLDALAWIWSSITDPTTRGSIERIINNRAVDTAGAASFASGYADGAYLTLASDRRTDAIVLDALIANAPKSDLVAKVVAGLLAHKTKGRWNNMQENSFALLAFKRYYDTYENVTPNFVARAWVGEKFAGEHAFTGRQTDRSSISVPMKSLIENGNSDLVVSKDGLGRMYYRIGLRYVPADLKLSALDRGFVVKRVYESVGDKGDVTQDADGTWKIKAGAKVKIRLTMVAESQRTHVALIDPLPAGLEALNPFLANTEQVVTDPNDTTGSGGLPKRWWWGPWYDFQQFRDDRSEAFTTYLSAGVYEYSYIARATTPGSFVVPPTRAEEMYAPETFGRTATDRVVIQ